VANSAVDIGWRLDRLNISRFHWRVLALIAAGMFFDSFDLYLASGVLGALVQSGESTLALNATFISATLLGMMIGAWCAGLLGDRFGRKFSYQFNLMLFGGASLAGAFCPSMQWLIVARFFMGLGLGAEIVVGYGTISEFIPARHRGRFAALLNLIINSSLFLATVIGGRHRGERSLFQRHRCDTGGHLRFPGELRDLHLVVAEHRLLRAGTVPD
jgi:putative MFS transporter